MSATMSPDVFLALLTFALVSSITPGPNNTMVLASGLNFGVRRSVPHMLGIAIGFTTMVFLVGVGLGNIFKAYPTLYTALKYLGGGYMIWLAWKIATSGPMENSKAGGTPIGFIAAALFQWVNPKAWIMAVTANATYTIVGHPFTSALVVAGAFAASSVPSNLTWVMFGAGLRKLLSDPKTLRIFNIAMAVLLVASLAPLLYH
jgi:threonine/homoserine/homoserine lactone efflux protein